jgi:serine/threonine-protein kinase
MVSCAHCRVTFLRARDLCTRCGVLLRPPRTTHVIGGRFALERTIGAGTMGVVHLARDLVQGTAVALKLAPPDRYRDAGAVERFAREFELLAAVHSRHVVVVLARGCDDGRPWIAMEHVDGRDLDLLITEYVMRGVSVPLELALAIARDVARGLEAVHAAGIAHRDVKPSNVIVERATGRAVLVDFGLARPFARGSALSLGAGTPWYMAPEQEESEADDEAPREVSPRTDVYALGCTLFEIFTGRPPFYERDPSTLRHLHASACAPALSSLRPSLAHLDATLARALAKRADARWQSCGEFVAALSGG